jgi:hypothetical protein
MAVVLEADRAPGGVPADVGPVGDRLQPPSDRRLVGSGRVERDPESGGQGRLGRVPGSPADGFASIEDVDRQATHDQEVERRHRISPDIIGHR